MKGKARKRQGKRNTESWRTLIYPGLSVYEVSNRGRVRKVKGKLIPSKPSGNKGDLRVRVVYNVKPRVQTHLVLKSIVADHWLRPRTIGKRVYFLDKNTQNCDVRNLREKGVTRYKNRRITPGLLADVQSYFQHDTVRGNQTRACIMFGLNKSTVSLIKRKERYYVENKM